MKTLEEFWPFYVAQHLNPTNRALHFIGTNLGLACAGGAAALGRPGLVLSGLVAAYGLAWIGHFFFERNTPATFEYPLLSLRADFRMLRLMWAGAMSAEIARLSGELRRLRAEA